MNDVLWLPEGLLDALLAEADAAGDVEICGFLGADARGWLRYAMTNRAPRAGTRFEIDPAQQIAAFRHMRQSGGRLAVIYHSHPRGEARPSARDVDGHGYPRTPALIIAPRAARGAPIRAWRMDGPAPRELPLDRSQAPWRDAFL